MMASIANISLSNYLEDLCEHLESGEPVPERVAKTSAELIRSALDAGGKLDLGKRSGRPSIEEEKLQRSDEVAFLRVQGLTREQAINRVAQGRKLKPITVRKNYDKYRRYSDTYAKVFTTAPLIERLITELQDLLTKFKNRDGSRLLSSHIAYQIAGSLNPRDLRPCISEIESALRRDISLLRDVLSPAYDDVLSLFELLGTKSTPI